MGLWACDNGLHIGQDIYLVMQGLGPRHDRADAAEGKIATSFDFVKC